ncbi:MAG: DUF5688 family protein [Butyrivibrio sp.]|jgi:hypothetical protein|nr:DUF5688 family protein [Butyrivibrio sp.]
MTFNEFSKEVINNLQEYAGSTGQISMREITKNNGLVLHGITWTNAEMNCSPTVYLDGFYEKYREGMEMSEIMMKLIETFESYTPQQKIDMSFFTDYTQVKDKIIFKLIGYEQNQEMLTDMPHIRYQNLAVVFYCTVEPQVRDGIVMIHNNHLKIWNVDAQELYETALRNSPKLCPASITGLRETVGEIMGEGNIAPGKDEMKVLTNRGKMFGAACILYPGLLQEIADGIGENLFILPSSIHEVILLSDTEEAMHSGESLLEVVKDVNRSVVDREDILADSVYYFDRSAGTLRICS